MGNTPSATYPGPAIPRSKRNLCKRRDNSLHGLECHCTKEDIEKQRDACRQFKRTWEFADHYKCFVSTNRTLCQLHERFAHYGPYRREEPRASTDLNIKVDSVLIVLGSENQQNVMIGTGMNVGAKQLHSIFSECGLSTDTIRNLILQEIGERGFTPSTTYKPKSSTLAAFKNLSLCNFRYDNVQENLHDPWNELKYPTFFIGCTDKDGDQNFSVAYAICKVIKEISKHLQEEHLEGNVHQIAKLMNARDLRIEMTLTTQYEDNFDNGTLNEDRLSYKRINLVYFGEGVTSRLLGRMVDVWEFDSDGMFESEKQAEDWLPCSARLSGMAAYLPIKCDALDSITLLLEDMRHGDWKTSSTLDIDNGWEDSMVW
ncbi:hypothetical protein NCAS_0A00390 [Naumovozyma castellii]|uniref:Uncharacterized protein n=1 Tax=Naumovozyma castellii TaxID=27288 RepID=G0V563_NAUCA|nr:hypothetical protein NCAS_0A00390 [Naumovozyma castellii CBS 4309]CCC66599.1 hypothetical protein NCAS_0A00390 [Naumovozyma castellii CBS 4309]